MKQGLNNSEVCRLLGIHRKTGQRWRRGRRHRARGLQGSVGVSLTLDMLSTSPLDVVGTAAIDLEKLNSLIRES